jgi:hypothetical protein
MSGGLVRHIDDGSNGWGWLMTRVSGLAGAAASRPGSGVAGGGGRVAGPGFAIPAQASGSAGSITTVTLGGLIALQEDACPLHRDRAARRGGERVLEALGSIQIATLDGDGTTAIAALNDAVAAMSEPADPGLRQIIGAIRLRAKVELARNERV